MARKVKVGAAIPDDVRELFLKHDRALAAGRAQYAKADKLAEQIIERCEVGVQLTLEADGKNPPRTLTLTDQFAETNQIWTGASAKRLVIKSKDIKPQDR